MGNRLQIDLVDLLIRDVGILRERLIRTDKNQFEPNITDKRRITDGLRASRRKISNLIAISFSKSLKFNCVGVKKNDRI